MTCRGRFGMPEYENRGGALPPPPAMSRVTLPAVGIFINGCRILSYGLCSKFYPFRPV